MARKTRSRQGRSLLMRAVSSLAEALLRRSAGDGNGGVSEPPRPEKRVAAIRRPRREADIPLEQLQHAYTPTQTSLKGPFRASGADRQRDQEYAQGVSDERWKDEDRYTNKSGDPRIGTHGRKYEPGE